MILGRISNITLILLSRIIWNILSSIWWARICIIVLRRIIGCNILWIRCGLVLSGIRLIVWLFWSLISFLASLIYLFLSLIGIYGSGVHLFWGLIYLWISLVYLFLGLICICWGAIHLFWSLIRLTAWVLIRCLVLFWWRYICILCLVLRRIISWLFILLLSRLLRSCLIRFLL